MGKEEVNKGDLREAMIKILITAGQAEHQKFVIMDLENQRQHWMRQAQEYQKLAQLVGARLEYLLLQTETEDNYITFPDGTLYMTGARLIEHNKKVKETEEGIDIPEVV